MEQEKTIIENGEQPVLNAHNKNEYEPSHTGGMNSL